MSPDTIGSLLTAMGYGAYVPVAVAIIGTFSAAAAALPPATPQSARWWIIARAVLDTFALNVGNAKNANAVPITSAAVVGASTSDVSAEAQAPRPFGKRGL